MLYIFICIVALCAPPTTHLFSPRLASRRPQDDIFDRHAHARSTKAALPAAAEPEEDTTPPEEVLFNIVHAYLVDSVLATARRCKISGSRFLKQQSLRGRTPAADATWK